MSATRNLAVILSVIPLSSGVGFAQATGPTEQVKQRNAVIGKWVNQEQWRTRPTEPWEKVTSEWDTRWVAGGFFVETPGKRVFANGQEDTWEQADNYTKADARCERLTDGEWWVYQKARGPSSRGHPCVNRPGFAGGRN